MRKPTFLKLAIGVVVILTVAGVGYAGLMVWRDRVSIESGSEQLVGDGEPAEEAEPSSPPDPVALNLDTSDWSTYRNEEYRLEMKYDPRVFVVVPIEGSLGYYGEADRGSKLIFADREENLGKRECFYGEAGVAMTCRAELEDGISFAVLPKPFSEFQDRFKDFDPGVPPKEATIAGERGVYFFTNLEHTHVTEYYYIPFGKERTLLIQVDSTAAETREGFRRVPSEEAVDQILSTFLFIDNQEVETSDWKGYRNDGKFGFEIKYPHDWIPRPSGTAQPILRISTARPKEFIYGKLPGGHAEISVRILYRSRTVSLDDWITNAINPGSIKSSIRISDSVIKIGDFQGRDITYMSLESTYQQKGRVIFIPQHNDIFNRYDVLEVRLYYHQGDDKANYYEAVFNQMLSTLRFIEGEDNSSS